MRRSLLMVLGLLSVSCGGGDRFSLWRVALAQAIDGPECMPSQAGLVVTSDLLTFNTWEIWEGEGTQRVLAGVGSQGTQGGTGYACTFMGAALTCSGTLLQVLTSGTGSTTSTQRYSTAVAVTATFSGDLMSGEVRSTRSVTCEGSCQFFMGQPACTTTTAFTGFRLHAEPIRPI